MDLFWRVRSFWCREVPLAGMISMACLAGVVVGISLSGRMLVLGRVGQLLCNIILVGAVILLLHSLFVRFRHGVTLGEEETVNYRNLFEAANDAIWIHELEGAIIDCNAQTCKLLGYADRTEIIGKTPLDFSPERQPDGELSLAKLKIFIKRQEVEPSFQFDWTFMNTAGNLVCCEVSVCCINFEGHMFGQTIMRDITARKAAHDDLMRFSVAIDQAAEAIAIADAEGILQYVNPAFERISGCGRDEALGRSFRQLKSDMPDGQYRQLQDQLAAGKSWEGRICGVRRDGVPYTEEMSVAPVFDDGGERISLVVVMRDVSKDLKQQEHCRHAQKMEAVGLLAGGVSHGFNNLLQRIIGYGTMLDAGLKEGPQDQRQFVAEILSAARRGSELTRQLLTFSRQLPAEKTLQQLDQVVELLVSLLPHMLGNKIELKMSLGTRKSVMADAGQLSLVLMNLSVNAGEAMPDGGHLTISTCEQELETPLFLENGSSRAGSYVCLSVMDSGCGISAKVKPRIFDPFFSTKGNTGMGLGLTTVYGIVQEHGGWVEVFSLEGEGTTVEIWLPAVDALSTTADEGEVAGNQERILLIEDDDGVRDFMEMSLELAGYKVLSARSAAEAIQRCESIHGDYQLACCDVVLPDGSGFDLIKKMHARYGSRPVLLCSGNIDDYVSSNPAQWMQFKVLQKPISALTLQQTVHDLLEQASLVAGSEQIRFSVASDVGGPV